MRQAGFEQIKRITEYERKLNEATMLLNSKQFGSILSRLLSELEAYYTSDEWKQDFEADEAGLLPPFVRRGVLSEDGICNLLDRAREEEFGTTAVYRDEHYTLGKKDGTPYLKAGEKEYTLTCHPYEPCLYITDTDGNMTIVHNAFEPLDVLDDFSKGSKVTSITGYQYGAEDFCRMVEYAAGQGNISIRDAESIFGNWRENVKAEKSETVEENNRIIKDESVNSVLADYPDSVVDYCIVENDHIDAGKDSHWLALMWTCRELLTDEESGWHYDLSKADAQEITALELFAPVSQSGELNYRKAFLEPPYEISYNDSDFERINAALFPKGTGSLEVYKWTTDWSDYFDDGGEGWGALCFSVYDKACDRFVIILASLVN